MDVELSPSVPVTTDDDVEAALPVGRRKGKHVKADKTKPAATVGRRNERERNRVKQVNLGFERLRQYVHLPGMIGAKKKLSKVDTLRAAVDYIHRLQQLLDADNTDDTACRRQPQDDDVISTTPLLTPPQTTYMDVAPAQLVMSARFHQPNVVSQHLLPSSLPVATVVANSDYMFSSIVNDGESSVPTFGGNVDNELDDFLYDVGISSSLAPTVDYNDNLCDEQSINLMTSPSIQTVAAPDVVIAGLTEWLKI